jgi:4-hydroxy-3-methylbut-2-enyl diphosphate reductase
MKIITATSSGMCFGVRDALESLARIDQPDSFAIYGELVHNDVVLVQLETRGFHQILETNRVETPPEPNVIITAHGISDRRRRELVSAGKTLIDTTCPLVTRVHRAAQEWSHTGAFIVVIGKPDHVEVQGITEDLDSFAVVATVGDVKNFSVDQIAIVCQTTFPVDEAAVIRRHIQDLNPDTSIHWIDTICQPTKDRQQALQDLLNNVQAVVVVGGHHSNNTRRLVDKCRQVGVTTFHIQDAAELDPQWFVGFESVGLTAGTSTLPETLQAVLDRLELIAATFNSCPTTVEHAFCATSLIE